MLKDVVWAEDGTYKPNGNHQPLEFFTAGLKNSTQFDLQLGYFNSAALSVLSYSFASFISNGGKMRMAINQIVSENDKKAFEEGLSGNVKLDFPIDLTNLEELKDTLDEYGLHFFKCLAYLIQEQRIELKIIKPKNEIGIAHTKCGQFSDNEMIVSFTGSANFTLSGFFNNKEEIVISLSSSLDPIVQKRIERQRKDFNLLMNEEDEDVEYLDAKDLQEAISAHFGGIDVAELLEVEKQLKAYKEINSGKNIASDDFITPLEPLFPYKEGPRDYQKQAFENWKNNGQKGLFAMATGTGKTLTALNCLLEIYKRKGYYKAIILVPTITLVEQWERECRKFNFTQIYKVCSGNPDWKDNINRLHFEEQHSNNDNFSYIIIITYASFPRKNVFPLINRFSKGQVLLIADEAHNMGSSSILKRMKDITYLRRIGLSATPERQFDRIGNEKINKFFGVNNEYTFEYSMKKAIENGVLCKYMYFPHLVSLTEEEMTLYAEYSLKIAKYYNAEEGIFDFSDEILKSLLLARKRIIHKAENKLSVFKEIINKRFEENGHLKYTLVYVPEGNNTDEYTADIFDNSEALDDDYETYHLIDKYTKAISDLDKRITVKMFTGNTNDRDVILNDFSEGKMQVLTSMKCLDEGIDVPRSELAIFCASTGNPRQFIQRRGRILRTHKDKEIAIIHDLVVIPKIEYGSPSFRMEQSLLASELKRVKDFATLSENMSYAQLELLDVMNYYGLNLFNNDHIL